MAAEWAVVRVLYSEPYRTVEKEERLVLIGMMLKAEAFPGGDTRNLSCAAIGNSQW